MSLTTNDASSSENTRQFTDFSQYDLYVLTGGGYMCDSDKRFILPLLDRIESAKANGKLVFMVGQGMGPIEDAEVIRRAKQVLPRVDYILTREERLTRPLLESLGVPQEKVLMTRDDAIELAYRAQKPALGNDIGLSLRLTAYTDFNQSHIHAIRPAIFKAAEKYNAVLISAPIDANDADKEYVAELMRGYGKTSASWKKFESAAEIIERISRCRIMITGTFHGAVFAISQGIPVIGLAKSVEYRNKISGLATEFGAEGCQIIDMKNPDFAEHLAKAIEFAWSNSERLRPHLLREAKRQIDLGHVAYEQIRGRVEAELKIHSLGSWN